MAYRKLPAVQATASIDDGSNGAPNAIDGNPATRWSGLGRGASITVDLGRVYRIHDVDINWHRGDVRANKFTISTSKDGTNFDDTFKGESTPNAERSEKYNLHDSDGRYVRVVFEGNNENEWASITEIMINGDDVIDPEYTGRSIVVTPQNRELLINDGGVNYDGTTAEYVRIYKAGAGSGPAIVCPYENLEIELDTFTESGSGRLYQICSRGGRHTSAGDPCTGSCYKGVFEATQPHSRKELFHRSSSAPGGNGYCSDRTTNRQSYQSIMGRRAKLKVRIRNIESSGDVQIENFVDGVRVQTTVDRGDWPWTKSNLPTCPGLQFGNTGSRKANEKLNKAGEWVILRADDVLHRMYSCTIREMRRL